MRYDNMLFWYLLLTVFAIGCSGGGMPITPTSEPPPSQFQGIGGPFTSGSAQPPGVQQDDPGEPPQPCRDPPAPQSYLGGGHPIEGVNARRNNRSPYLLPQSLENGQKIDELFDPDYPYTKGVSELVINGTEQIYLGCFDGGGQTFQNGSSWHSRYQLYSFQFGDSFGDENPGGVDIVLTNDRVYTTSYKSNTNKADDMGYSSTLLHRWSCLLEYDPWPVIAYEESTYWGSWSWYNMYPFSSFSEEYGNWDGRFFDTIFPLPDGKLLISYTKPKCSYDRKGLQLLDDRLQRINGYWLDVDIIGSAYDENTGNIYTTTDDSGRMFAHRHLYCSDSNLNKQWDADHLWNNFSEWLPVIDDEGGALGVYNSRLRRVEPDGVAGNLIYCGAQTRPAILNDGAIAVICETYLKTFDTELNEIARFPLPSGLESGKAATHAPLVDALDNMALILGPHLCIVDRAGNVIAQRTFEDDIKLLRLGPEHLFVALDYAIYRFPS